MGYQFSGPSHAALKHGETDFFNSINQGLLNNHLNDLEKETHNNLMLANQMSGNPSAANFPPNIAINYPVPDLEGPKEKVNIIAKKAEESVSRKQKHLEKLQQIENEIQKRQRVPYGLEIPDVILPSVNSEGHSVMNFTDIIDQVMRELGENEHARHGSLPSSNSSDSDADDRVNLKKLKLLKKKKRNNKKVSKFVFPRAQDTDDDEEGEDAGSESHDSQEDDDGSLYNNNDDGSLASSFYQPIPGGISSLVSGGPSGIVSDNSDNENANEPEAPRNNLELYNQLKNAQKIQEPDPKMTKPMAIKNFVDAIPIEDQDDKMYREKVMEQFNLKHANKVEIEAHPELVAAINKRDQSIAACKKAGILG